MIEARIVNIDSNYSRELGVKWSGGKDLTSSESNRGIGIGGQGTTIGSPTQGVTNNPFVDLGVTGTNAASLAIGFATNSYHFESGAFSHSF